MKTIKKKVNEDLKERFSNTCKFYNLDINKFIWFWGKDFNSYEYLDDTDDWKISNETLLP